MKYTQPNVQRSALITIDTQADFSDRSSPYAISGTCDVIPNMTHLLAWYRKHDLPIIHIIRLYQSDGSNVDLCRKELIEGGAKIAAPGSHGAELVDALKPNKELKLDADQLLQNKVQYWSEKEAIIYKPRWGAFYNTPLQETLNQYSVNTLVFCGCNFPNCPRTSIYQASERDYRVILIEDAISQIYDKGKEELKAIGVSILSTDSFLQHPIDK